MTDKFSVVERLMEMADQAIARERAALKAEYDLRFAKLAERKREVEAAWKRVNPPTLEPKSEPQPNIVAETPTPPEMQWPLSRC